jgi:hypothetical protein
MPDKWHIMTIATLTLLLLMGAIALIIVLPIATGCYIWQRWKYDNE